MSFRTVTLWLSLASVLSAQDVELTGRVVGKDGAPVPGARITFEPLPMPPLPVPGVRGAYDLAQRLHLARTKLPRAATDRDGDWRVSLTPVQAALATSGLSRFLMRIDAPAHVGWQRCLDGDLRGAAANTARLEPKQAAPPLRLSLRGMPAPIRGCVVVERPFRVARTRTIWISDLLTVAPDGTCAFDQPVRVPGEPPPAEPSAREEAYRVTVHVAGAVLEQRTVPPGATEIELEPSAWRPRRVLAERAAPAALPCEATYQIAGREVVVAFDTPDVPLLGDSEPVRIHTGSGEVDVDPWDPDVPLFVGAGRTPKPDENAQSNENDAPAADASLGALEIAVEDASGAPLGGAGVWIENGAVKRAVKDADVFAVSDAGGRARLRSLPLGTFGVLVQHPVHGTAEILADITAAGRRATARLAPLPVERQADTAPRPGTLLLELAAQGAEAKLAIGIVETTRVVWRRFDDAPRQVRLEGLALGPYCCFVRSGDRAPVFVSGMLDAADGGTVAVDPTVAATVFTLQVALPAGAPPDAIRLSLGDGPDKTGVPRSAELFPVERRADGAFTAAVAARGSLWVRVWAEGHEPADLLLDPAQARAPLRVALQAKPEPVPPPEPERAPEGPQPRDG